jgi:uncharacterized protein involved in exopolysaccharide biosynthesis
MHTNGNGLEKRAGTMRDTFGVLFRRRRLLVWSFLGTFLGAVLVTFVIINNRYEGLMKVLVSHERSDSVVSAGRSSEQQPAFNDTVSNAEVNTEVSLLMDDDLIRQVVLENKLQDGKGLRDYLLFFLPQTPEQRIQNAVKSLEKSMDVQPETNANLIDVDVITYFDAGKAAAILKSLEKFYLQKHVAVYTPPATVDFFEKETALYQKGLQDAEARLASFSRETSSVSPQLERDKSVEKLTDFIGSLRKTQADITQSEQRIQNLEQQLSSTPERMTTLDHVADAGMLLEQQKSTLLTLELQKTQMLTKYDPSYPPVKDIETQIAQTQAAIAQAEKAPLHDATTDKDPTHELLREDLAKAREELASLKGLEAGTARAIAEYRTSTVQLEEKSLEAQDLLREAKADEGNYLLYLQKREDARVSDAMNARDYANVTIAQEAVAPAIPVFSPLLSLLVGFLISVLVSLGTVFTAEFLDDSLRTPDDVAECLEVPVFASIPQNSN